MNSRRKNIRFISYIKGVSVCLVMLIHFYGAFFNFAGWSNVVRTPEIELVYPKLMQLIIMYSFEGIQGFIVVGAVALFFLASGYTSLGSLENRGFISFWARKIKRLVPFYGVVLCINMLVAFLASCIYHTGFNYTLTDILLQMLMGLQYFVPNAVVLDYVIWFLAVMLVFWLVASVLLKPQLGRWRYLIFDSTIVLLLMLIGKMMYMDGAPFMPDNYHFMFKTLVLCLFVVIGTMFADKKHGGCSYCVIISQLCLFLIVYRFYINEVAYVGVNEYMPWFACYFLIFWLLFTLDETLPNSRLLNWLSDISFSLYFCHGYMGYFIVVTLMFCGISKGLSALLAIPVVLAEALFLHRYIEKC